MEGSPKVRFWGGGWEAKVSEKHGRVAKSRGSWNTKLSASGSQRQPAAATGSQRQPAAATGNDVGPAAQTLPSTRAGGQDDVSSEQTPSN